MENNFFALISRMRYINRWGLMRNTFQENVQEHSHMVAVIAHALAVIRNELFGGHIDADRAAVLALYHDAPEIFTGDLPTPVKYHSSEIREAYRAVEEVSVEKLLAMLPPELRGTYGALLSERQDELYMLVKTADKLSAYIKCMEELKAGNSEFKQAAEQTLAALEQNPLPEAQYFIRNFLPGFGLTLDELQKP